MDQPEWVVVKEYQDITYKKCNGVARIAFNRPNVRNAFRPKTTSELYDAFYDANEDVNIGVVLLSAEGPSTKDGVFSFCSGGDQKARGHQGYVGEDGYHRLNILEVQRLIRFMPKAVIAVVPGWAVGGGHSLHVVCDLTLASKEHAIFKQTDADVTSFDGGYGSAYLAKIVNYFGENPKDNPMVVTVSLLFSFFSQLLHFHGLKDKSPRSVASALRVNPYFVNDYITAARNFPMRKVSTIVSTLREFDVKSKGVGSNAVPQGDLLRELMVKILS